MSDQPLAMNPFVDIHIHPAPEAYPIDVARITSITLKCPVRGRGLQLRELTAAGDPALFAFFCQLVARDGELELDSDAPLIDTLVAIGFLIEDGDIVEWPQLAIPLTDLADSPEPDRSDANGPTSDADALTADTSWIVAPSFRFQPAFALHPDVRWPADYAEQEGRLRCFAPGPAFWVGEPGALVAPRWVTADEAAVLAPLIPGASPPPLPPALARALAHAGALIPSTNPPDPLAAFRRHRAAYDADGYAIARDFLPAAELAALRRYYAALLAADLVQLGDRQNAQRYSAYNDPVGRFVHARLAVAMSAVVGQPVEPSFSYLFSYLEGAHLAPHKDRAQAEFSISLQVDHSPGHRSGHSPAPTPAPTAATGWPLCFTFDDGRAAAADLRIGDAVLYHGRALTHHRPALPAGQRSTLLVLEYVPLDFAGLRI